MSLDPGLVREDAVAGGGDESDDERVVTCGWQRMSGGGKRVDGETVGV